MPNGILHEMYDGARMRSYTAGSVRGVVDQTEIYKRTSEKASFRDDFLKGVRREDRVE